MDHLVKQQQKKKKDNWEIQHENMNSLIPSTPL